MSCLSLVYFPLELHNVAGIAFNVGVCQISRGPDIPYIHCVSYTHTHTENDPTRKDVSANTQSCGDHSTGFGGKRFRRPWNFIVDGVPVLSPGWWSPQEISADGVFGFAFYRGVRSQISIIHSWVSIVLSHSWMSSSHHMQIPLVLTLCFFS